MRKRELDAQVRWAVTEMAAATFDPFSGEGSRITFLWTDARDQLAALKASERVVDPAALGRGTGELPSFRFELD